MVSSLLPWIQVILAVLVITLVLFQQSEAGLGAAFGGDAGGGYAHTKRGLERTLFLVTIAAGALFIASTIVALFVK